MVNCEEGTKDIKGLRRQVLLLGTSRDAVRSSVTESFSSSRDSREHAKKVPVKALICPAPCGARLRLV
jgi:hypothetical protein